MGEISVSSEDRAHHRGHRQLHRRGKGNPTTADDVPQWSSSDDTIASRQPVR